MADLGGLSAAGLLTEILVYEVRSCNGNDLLHEHLLPVTQTSASSEEKVMDKDRIKGSATGTGGKIKQAAGDITSDSKLQSEGKMDQAKGRLQNAVGSVKDALEK
jgi:uncharacterized protein YjbJ (UPF0337 family)